MTPAADVARIRVENADAALEGLLEEWLAEQGCRLAGERPDLVLIDLPLRRLDAAALVLRVRGRYPATPVIAVSSNFCPGVETSGAVARALGVDAVLPKPLSREALMGALRRLLPQLE
jgi:CheY-like chemotaxis protein